MKLSTAVLLLLAAPLIVAGSACWKDAYKRDVCKATTSCRCDDGFEQEGSLCYPKCKNGYDGNGSICWKNCPSPMNPSGSNSC